MIVLWGLKILKLSYRETILEILNIHSHHGEQLLLLCELPREIWEAIMENRMLD